MPTLKHPPDSNVTPGPFPANHFNSEAFGVHIYPALAAAAIFVALCLVTARLGWPQTTPSWTPNDFRERKGRLGPKTRKDSAASYGKHDSAVRPLWARDQRGVRLSFGRKSPQPVRTAGLSPLGASSGQPWLAGQLQAMDGIEKGEGKDRSGYPGSAPPASRGVSTSDPSVADQRRQEPPSLDEQPSVSSVESRRGNRSPLSSSHAPSPPRRYGGSSDGAGDQRVKGQGYMTGHGARGGGSHSLLGEGISGIRLVQATTSTDSARDDGTGFGDPLLAGPFSRPPPPPPLTPPALSSAVFPFENRRHGYAVSIPPELDTSFFHQPNPDYLGDSTSTDVFSSSPKSATATPRRRSYTRSIPIGIPIPAVTSASSSTETMTSAETFSPSSYPPTSPLLPPPPPGNELPYDYKFVGGHGGPGITFSEQEIDIHGEIISVTDGEGHGWKRHTRVYGGGVCLACVAAGEEGGFYGDKVPLEDRR